MDRMDEVREENDPIMPNRDFENFDINAYKSAIFRMYTGEQTDITLVFPKDLIDVAVDRFGGKTEFISFGNEEVMIHTQVIVSKTFFSWLTTFEGKVKIYSPVAVKEKYKAFLHNLFSVVE